MGWLRDLMARSTPPVASLGELARLSLAHRDWPAEGRIQARSLATLFSKLDRGQELDWLRDRPREQDVIAGILRLPLLDLKSALGERPEATDVRRVRLRDVRFARELDLGREDLPPGFPKRLFERTEWTPLVWVAPSGAGRGLFGTFLTARGLAQVCPYSQTTELRKVPARGPLFLDLGPEVELDEHTLEDLRIRHRPVCIAAHRHQIRASLPDSHFVHSPPASEYLSSLIDWVRERLAPDSTLDPDRAEPWIQRQLASPASLGDLLGMIGLLDELPHREVSRLSLEEALRRSMEKRLLEAAAGESMPKKLASVAFDALTEAAAKTLVESGQALPEGLTIDSWSRLLEARASDLTDPVWLESALAGANLTARELERITKNLPPSGHRLVRALIAASILHLDPSPSPLPGDRYVLSPHCLRGTLRQRAARESLRLSPSEWGQALLRQANMDGEYSVQEALEEQAVLGDFRAHEEIADSFDESAPEHGAGIEASLESLGVALLRGHSVPEELARDTISAFARVGVLLDGVWEPRFRPRARFFSSFLALLEHHAVLPPPTDPLRSERGAALVEMVHAIAGSLESCTDHELSGASWALLFRLSLSSPEPIPKLPVLEFLRSASAGRPSPQSLTILEQTPWEVLQDALNVLGIGPSTLFSDLWSTLRGLPSDRVAVWLDRFAPRSGPLAEGLWRSAPDGLLGSLGNSGLIPFETLLPHQLATLTERWAQPLPAPLGAYCPLSSALTRAERLGMEGFSAGALKNLTSRFPIAFGRVCLARAMDHQEAQGFDSLERARTLHAVLDELPETAALVSLSPLVRDALRRALLEEVRTPNSESSRQTAYRRLTELDRALWPLLKASSSIRNTPGTPSSGTQFPT